MRIIPASNKTKMGETAAHLFAAQIVLKPDSVLGLATGDTPRELYAKLIEWHKEGTLDFSQITTFNLDEYVGLAPQHDQSYHYYMQDALFDHVNLRAEYCHVPDGTACDLLAACREYDQRIADFGGIDMQLLGIGVNGHIAFNEPDTHFEKGTHVVQLTPSTISVNSQYFASPQEMPTSAVTMGIKSIFQAKRIVLIASGSQKAEIVHQAFFGQITPKVPASILQMHKDVTLVADEDALRIVREKEGI